MPIAVSGLWGGEVTREYVAVRHVTSGNITTQDAADRTAPARPNLSDIDKNR
jgi:hypothetical protein